MASTRICDVCEEEISTKGMSSHVRGHKATSTKITVTKDPQNPNSAVLNRWPISDDEKADVRRQIAGA